MAYLHDINQWIFPILLVLCGIKLLLWLCDTGADHDDADEVSWFAEIRARPSLLIAPGIALTCLMSLLVIIFLIAHYHAICIAFLPILFTLKWLMITLTIISINRVIWIIFFETIESSNIIAKLCVGLGQRYAIPTILIATIMLLLGTAEAMDTPIC